LLHQYKNGIDTTKMDNLRESHPSLFKKLQR
jgi:hypothetical protein